MVDVLPRAVFLLFTAATRGLGGGGGQQGWREGEKGAAIHGRVMRRRG
jgi:hypothetical protein